MLRALVALATARVGLAAAELRAEGNWVKTQMRLIAAAIALAVVALILGLALLILLLPESSRIPAVAIAFGTTLLLAIASVAIAKVRHQSRRPLLSITKSIIASDLARLGIRSLFR